MLKWSRSKACISRQQGHECSSQTPLLCADSAGDPVKAAEEMRAVVKALPDGDSKADDECPICMDAVTTGDWQVRQDTLSHRVSQWNTYGTCRAHVPLVNDLASASNWALWLPSPAREGVKGRSKACLHCCRCCRVGTACARTASSRWWRGRRGSRCAPCAAPAC